MHEYNVDLNTPSPTVPGYQPPGYNNNYNTNPYGGVGGVTPSPTRRPTEKPTTPNPTKRPSEVWWAGGTPDPTNQPTPAPTYPPSVCAKCSDLSPMKQQVFYMGNVWTYDISNYTCMWNNIY